jgi:hypothetical protein
MHCSKPQPRCPSAPIVRPAPGKYAGQARHPRLTSSLEASTVHRSPSRSHSQRNCRTPPRRCPLYTGTTSRLSPSRRGPSSRRPLPPAVRLPNGLTPMTLMATLAWRWRYDLDGESVEVDRPIVADAQTVPHSEQRDDRRAYRRCSRTVVGGDRRSGGSLGLPCTPHRDNCRDDGDDQRCH